MKFSVVAFVALAALTSAAPGKKDQDPEDLIPYCSVPCIEQFIGKHTNCALNDYQCICKHKDLKDKDTMNCIIKACGFSKAKNKVLPAVKKVCKGL